MGTKSQKIAAITRSVIGQPYALVSCIGLIDHVYRKRLGLRWLPKEWEGLTVKNFEEHLKADRLGTEDKMVRLFESLGAPADPDALAMLDLLILDDGECRFPAVYVGRGRAMTSTRADGVVVTPVGRGWTRVALARRLV